MSALLGRMNFCLTVRSRVHSWKLILDLFFVRCSSVAKVIQEEYSVSSYNHIERIKELLHKGIVTMITVNGEK